MRDGRIESADNAPTHAHARASKARAEADEVELFLGDPILAETISVLGSFYEYTMSRIADVMVDFLLCPGIAVADESLAARALRLAATQNVHFIDACLALRADSADEDVSTFDESGFSRLPVRWSEPARAHAR